jgi:hypothetical protein
VSSFKACKFKAVRRIFAPSPCGGNGLVTTNALAFRDTPFPNYWRLADFSLVITTTPPSMNSRPAVS